MSQYFQVGDRVLWNPSNDVAGLFVRTAEAIAQLVELPTGIGPMEADEYNIDMDTFSVFVDALVRRYSASSHPILKSLLEGFVATALVLVHRGDRSVPALSDTLVPEPRDVSVRPAGIAPPGSAARLGDLAEEQARAMPH